MHGHDTSPQRDYSYVAVINVVDEIVDTHRRLQLLGKSFNAWKRSSLSAHSVVKPITKSSLVDACCRWMRLSFSDYESSGDQSVGFIFACSYSEGRCMNYLYTCVCSISW